MKRLLIPLAALAIAGLLLPTGAPPAYACSVDPDFDLVAESDAIVGGRFTGWEIAGATDPSSLWVPVRVHMRVDRVFKGDVPSEIDIVDSRSLHDYSQFEDHDPKYVWAGASGACGAFDFDPTGVYAIMGLWEEEDGSYSSSIFGWFFVGEEPEGEYYARALLRLASLDDGPWPAVGLWSVLGVIALLAASAFLLRRRIIGRDETAREP